MSILYIGNSTEIFEQCAKEKNVSLIAVRNSIEGIQLLKSDNHINVIICDFNLPGNTGLFLFDIIKKEPVLSNIPFILITEEYNSKLYIEAFSKGISDYFVSSSTDVNDIINRAQAMHKIQTLNIEEIEKSISNKGYKLPITKRIFDVIFASLMLICIAPLMLIIMLAIRLESKGKVYYTAKRVGRNTFDFYKLRSMRSGSDEMIKKLAKENNQYKKEKTVTTIDFFSPCLECSKISGNDSCSPVLHIDNHKICDYWYNHQKEEIEKSSSTFIKILNDPRITKIGKFIRNTSIDELPQLINVIKGDMSIVGNRPLPVYEAELLTKDNMSKRFLAPAGITGLWQVELRGKGGKMSEEERMRLDNEYADKFTDNNYSFWYDIKLILRTIPGLIQKSTV
jgi:lipopolysaccharide/colanic/teichoic acid biosynthesis glycosyltransferase